MSTWVSIPVVGDTYTIADMSVWGWARLAPFVFGEETWNTLPNPKRLVAMLEAPPAAVRALAVKDRFTFKADLDAEARQVLFKHVKVSA